MRLQSRDAFSSYHPAVNFLYFGLVLFFTMCFLHPACLLLSLAAAARDSRLFLRGLTVSPIHGTNGNVEYLAAFSRRDALDEDETAALVAAALAEQPDE